MKRFCGVLMSRLRGAICMHSLPTLVALWLLSACSDVICEFPLREMLAFHRKTGAEGTILVTQARPPSPGHDPESIMRRGSCAHHPGRGVNKLMRVHRGMCRIWAHETSGSWWWT